MKQDYKVGIYCRISVEDAVGREKRHRAQSEEGSVSIENQRELLLRFASFQQWDVAQVYCDDGYSGADFSRPAFARMVSDVKRGVINLVLVKDLSRLGRDYIQVGGYTDNLFPACGCRFVSLLDCLDSQSDCGDLLQLRSLMNDYHLKDLSHKIKSVLYAKMRGGQFLSARAPYGYERDIASPHQLAIDPQAAEVVGGIYRMRIAGLSYGRIAAELNRRGIPSPARYRAIRQGDAEPNSVWMNATIRAILSNPVYLGTLLQNQRGTRSYKDRTELMKPPAQWFFHFHHHQAIVTPEEWDAAQTVSAQAATCRKNCAKPAGHHFFAGMLLCADCRAALVAQGNTYYCSRYLGSGGSACAAHRVQERTLGQLISAELTAYAQEMSQQICNRLTQALFRRQTIVTKEMEGIRRAVTELGTELAKQYEAKAQGKISAQQFQLQVQECEQARLAAEQALRKLEIKKERLEKMDESSCRSVLEQLCRHPYETELRTLIHHMELKACEREGETDKQTVAVWFRCRDPIPALKRTCS